MSSLLIKSWLQFNKARGHIFIVFAIISICSNNILSTELIAEVWEHGNTEGKFEKVFPKLSADFVQLGQTEHAVAAHAHSFCLQSRIVSSTSGPFRSSLVCVLNTGNFTNFTRVIIK